MKLPTIVLKYILFFLIAFLPFTIQSQDTRWNLTKDNAIEWKVKQNDSHLDHIEMSGFYTSAIVYYGVEKGVLKQKTKLVFPMLRTIPNDTHASLIHDFESDTFDKLKVNGKSIIEYPSHFYHKGIIKIKSNTNTGVVVKHHLFPSTDQPVFIDKITLKNTTHNSVKIDLPDINYLHTTDAEKGVTGSYIISAKTSKRGVFSLRKE
jgi:hypothetical protein